MCIFTGKCVHKMERLYNTLFKKLNECGNKECKGENEHVGDKLDKGKYTTDLFNRQIRILEISEK